MGKSVIDDIKAMETKISNYEAKLKDFNKLVEIVVKNEFGMSVKDIHNLIKKHEQNEAKHAENNTHNQQQQRPAVQQKAIANQPTNGAQMQGKKPTILEQN